MSAYFVPKMHIDAMVTAALALTEPRPFIFRPVGGDLMHLTAENVDEIGTMLWLLNWEMTEGWIDPAEPDYVPFPEYHFERLPGDPDPLLILQIVGCYGYQTGSEREIYDPSPANAFVVALMHRAAARLTAGMTAGWPVEDREVFLRST